MTKILIKLDSCHFTDDQNQWCYDNMIALEWPLPFLPRREEHFYCETMIDNMPDFCPYLSWSVYFINYEKIDGVITPVLWLKGE